MKILAISGSLRAKSYNTSIIRALKNIDTNIDIYDDLREFPFFNPDLDKANIVLTNLIKVLTGNISKQLTLIVPMVNKKFDDNGQIIDKVLIEELHTLLDTLKLKLKKEKYV